MSWPHRRISAGIDKWFAWGVVAGVFVVVQLASFGVPGLMVYGWAIPLLFGFLYSEDTWHLISVLSIVGPSVVLNILSSWHR